MKLKSKIYAALLCGLVVAAPSHVEARGKKKTQAKVKAKPTSFSKAQVKPRDGLTTAQKQAASSAIRELRKLAVAAKIVSRPEKYSDRLIDATAIIEESLGNLPQGKLKENIKASLDAYNDAGIVWSKSVEQDYIKIYLDEIKDIITRYNIAQVIQKENPRAQWPYTAEEARFRNGSYGDSYNEMMYIKTPLKTMWEFASIHTQAAATLANQN